jgi:hypothetical protein
MKSKILVDYDFENQETFLQLRLEGWDIDGGELPDKHLKNFVEQAIKVGNMTIMFKGAGNGLPQIRIGCNNTSKPSPDTEELKEACLLLQKSISLFELYDIKNDTVERVKNFLIEPKVEFVPTEEISLYKVIDDLKFQITKLNQDKDTISGWWKIAGEKLQKWKNAVDGLLDPTTEKYKKFINDYELD